MGGLRMLKRTIVRSARDGRGCRGFGRRECGSCSSQEKKRVVDKKKKTKKKSGPRFRGKSKRDQSTPWLEWVKCHGGARFSRKKNGKTKKRKVRLAAETSRGDVQGKTFQLGNTDPGRGENIPKRGRR